MRVFPHDSDYTNLMLTIDREQAEALRATSRELRTRAAALVFAARRLRLRCARLSRQTAEVLRTCSDRAA